MKQLESLVLQYLFTPNRYRTLTLLAVKHPDTNWSAFPEATSIVCCVPHELRHGSLLSMNCRRDAPPQAAMPRSSEAMGLAFATTAIDSY